MGSGVERQAENLFKKKDGAQPSLGKLRTTQKLLTDLVDCYSAGATN